MDHAIINLFLSITKPPIIKAKTQSLQKIDSQQFLEDITSIFTDILDTQGPDIALEYYNRLSALLNKHAPLLPIK